MNLIRYLGVILSLNALLLPPALAEIPSASSDCVAGIIETTPSSDFTLLEGGAVVRHEATGLEWLRCAEGMDWTGSDCTGSAIGRTWQEALQYAQAQTQAGWRLPNIHELRSIVEECRVDPAINQQVFPNTPSSYFWSASPSAGSSDFAWFVSFLYGDDNWYDKSFSLRLRLVRGGQ